MLSTTRLIDTARDFARGNPIAGAERIVIAVVIPSYKVSRHILRVLDRIGPECDHIFVIDDCCPEKSGEYVKTNCRDPRVHVLTHDENRGVGGAVITGYRAAIAVGATIVVKIDGDGQMAPELIPSFVEPLIRGVADYTKGNRFYDLSSIKRMPRIRLVGNATLSFMTKLSSGYWDIFDPTNGYTAIRSSIVERLPLDKVSQRYFFESDMLFRLNTLRAMVVDVPMDAVYGDEGSNLRISRVVGEFLISNMRNFSKRIVYNYFLRDFSVASIELVAGIALTAFGVIFGASQWMHSAISGQPTGAGTVMVAAFPLLVGIQLIIAFLNYDISSVPRRAIHTMLPSQRE